MDSQRRQKLFYNRSHHQLREIEFSCREVITLSKLFNGLASDIGQSQLNSKKLEIIKAEIKDKLRQFASNIDQIYKILDQKMVIIMRELQRESMNGKQMGKGFTGSERGVVGRERGEMEKGSSIISGERMFSDTLNPRITNLQAKIQQYQQNEINYRKKIIELKEQNHQLTQEFERLSNASNATINRLTAQLHPTQIPIQPHLSSKPSLNLNLSNNPHLKSMGGSPSKVGKNKDFYQVEDSFKDEFQHLYQPQPQPQHLDFIPNNHRQTSFLTFGCIPNNQAQERPSLNINMQNNESYDQLDKNDRNRRWDLMLNKLRVSQQQSTQGSCDLDGNLQQKVFPFGSKLIKKHQI